MSQINKPKRPVRTQNDHWLVGLSICVSGFLIGAAVVAGSLSFAETNTIRQSVPWYERVAAQAGAVWSVITQTSEQILAGVPLQIAQVGGAPPIDLGGGVVTTSNTITGLPLGALVGTLQINTPLQVDNNLQIFGTTTFATTTITGSAAINGILSVSDTATFGNLTATGEATIGVLTVPTVATIGTLSVTGGSSLSSVSVAGLTELSDVVGSGEAEFALLTVTGNATVDGSLALAGSLTATGGIETRGADVNLGTGSLFAANVINQIIAGENIVITGTRNEPVISVATDDLVGVLSINDQTGDLDLVGGTDIGVSGLTIFNNSTLSSVRGRGGCVGCINDADVSSVLTIAGGTIDDTPIGSTTPAFARFTEVVIGTTTSSTTLIVGGNATISDTLTVSGVATSTFGGSINLTSGCFAINGVCVTGAAPSTYVGLSDTPNSLLPNALQYANASGTALTQSGNLVFSGGNLGVGTGTPITRLTVSGGDISLMGAGALRLYNGTNSQYVGFRASSTLSATTVWTLPASDGSPNQLLVTDGIGNLRFANISSIGGGATTYLELLDTPSTFATSSIPFVNASSTALTQSNTFVFRNGNLGVGVSDPTARLTVEGSIRLQQSPSQIGLTYGVAGNRFGFGTDSPTEFVTIQRGSLLQRGGTATSTYQPSAIASLPLVGNVEDISIAGNFAYAVSSFGGTNFFVVDITNPASPANVATLNLPSGALSIQVVGQYAYIGATFDGAGFYIVDISNPLNPVFVNSVPVPTDVRDIIVSGQYAYLAVGNALRVFDITNPLSPFEVASTTVSDNINGLALAGNYMYMASAVGGTHFHVVDITNPTAIGAPVANLSFGAAANDIDIRGTYAYVVTSNSSTTVRVVNISNPLAPTIIASTGLGTTGNTIEIAGRYAYVGTQAVGNTFYVIDIINPANPQIVGSRDLAAGNLLGMEIRGRYVYVVSSNINDRLHVVDITGAELQSAIVHSLEGGYLSVQGDSQIAGRLVAGLGLQVGNEGVQTTGQLAVLGTEASQIAGRLSIGTSSALYQLTIAGSIGLTGAFHDRNGSAGAAGMVLRSTGTSTEWVATSTLGLAAPLLTDTGATTYLTSLSDNFGIGTTSAMSRLTVDGSGFFTTTLTALGTASFGPDPYGNATVRIGNNATRPYLTIDDANEQISIGTGNTVNGAAISVASGPLQFKTGHNTDINPIDSGTTRMTILQTGNVGVGTTTPSQRLTVVGTIQSTALLGGATDLQTDAQGNIVRNPSDERLKQNITTIENPLEIILGLRGVRYEWIDTDRFGTQAEIGFLAQEVQVVLPEVVRDGGEYWSLRTANIVAVVVEAIKILWTQVQQTQSEVTNLRERVEFLEAQLGAQVIPPSPPVSPSDNLVLPVFEDIATTTNDDTPESDVVGVEELSTSSEDVELVIIPPSEAP